MATWREEEGKIWAGRYTSGCWECVMCEVKDRKGARGGGRS